MRLIWYGTASLILREGDASIAFDPFCKMTGKQTDPMPYEEDFRKVPQVFVTHGHFDHIYHIPRIYRDTPAAVRCTAAPKRTLLKNGFSSDEILEIGPGFHEQCGPFQITAYQGRHCVFDGPLLRQTVFSRRFWKNPVRLFRVLKAHLSHKEKGEILFYEVVCGQVRVQIMGSMNLDSDTEYPTGADVLVLPLQGRSDQDTYALGLVERLKPKAVLLDHYDDAFPPLSSEVDTSGFVRNVQERYGIYCEPLRKKCPVELPIYGQI